MDSSRTPQFGLVAEEVEKVDPDLIVRDKEGKPYSVRYDAVNAMLLNEFLKEHQKVETQQAEIANQAHKFATDEARLGKQDDTIVEFKKQIQTLTAALKEQAAQIQKVTAQVAINTPARRVANVSQ